MSTHKTDTKNYGRQFFSGVAALAVSTFIVKIIGMFYKIPMMRYLGAEGMGYFNSAYEIYSFCFVTTKQVWESTNNNTAITAITIHLPIPDFFGNLSKFSSMFTSSFPIVPPHPKRYLTATTCQWNHRCHR